MKRDSTLAKARLGLANELRKRPPATPRPQRKMRPTSLFRAKFGDRPATGREGDLIEIGDEAAATRHFERAMGLDPRIPRS